MSEINHSTDPKRRGPCVRSGRFLVALSAGIVFLGCTLASQVEAAKSPLRFGFTRSIFKNRNENDILAAMKVWAQTLSKERGVPIDPDMRIYRSTKEGERAVREKSVDALILLLSEYATFPRGLLGGPYFRDETQGSTHIEFVLLSRKDSDLKRPEDLRGAKLTVHDDVYHLLGTVWLEALLADSGLGSAVSVVAGIEKNPKLSAVVLNVFFGKSDACLVGREGFESMVELNPQVSKQLYVMAASPPVVPDLFFFRRELAEADKMRLFKEVMRLHETVTGEQVLRVFKSDRMAEITSQQLERSLGLLNEWQQSASGQSEPSAQEQGNAKDEDP